MPPLTYPIATTANASPKALFDLLRECGRLAEQGPRLLGIGHAGVGIAKERSSIGQRLRLAGRILDGTADLGNAVEHDAGGAPFIDVDVGLRHFQERGNGFIAPRAHIVVCRSDRVMGGHVVVGSDLPAGHRQQGLGPPGPRRLVHGFRESILEP